MSRSSTNGSAPTTEAAHPEPVVAPAPPSLPQNGPTPWAWVAEAWMDSGGNQAEPGRPEALGVFTVSVREGYPPVAEARLALMREVGIRCRNRVPARAPSLWVFPGGHFGFDAHAFRAGTGNAWPGFDDAAVVFNWSPWQPLRGAWLGDKLPSLPGLYRVRREGRDDLDYIGQTGVGTMTLRKRLGMLRRIYADAMPYRAPHTAGPALWALRQASGVHFEVSVLPVEGSAQWRKGLEALAIGLYRQERGRSPTVNFGRMPLGYRISSSNDARLVKAMKRFRGGPATTLDTNHLRGLAPIGSMTGDPQAPDWCGHRWSPWQPLADLGSLSIPAQGIYRLRASGAAGLLYLGEGKIKSRLQAHPAKCARPGHRQGSIFRGASCLECSWVGNLSWLPHQRQELETDLIAAHIVVLGRPPAAQFLGDQEAAAQGGAAIGPDCDPGSASG